MSVSAKAAALLIVSSFVAWAAPVSTTSPSASSRTPSGCSTSDSTCVRWSGVPADNDNNPGDGRSVAATRSAAAPGGPPRPLTDAGRRRPGTQARRVTTSTTSSDPAVSPDGSKIAFISADPGEPYQVFVINADGTGERYIGEGVNPQWSPDGATIAAKVSNAGARPPSRNEPSPLPSRNCRNQLCVSTQSATRQSDSPCLLLISNSRIP